MTDAEFYQTHLDRVSRSFAFCIAQLRAPLREWVGLSYLLCRAVDTIEDASWTDPVPQARAFARFDAALAGDADALSGLRAEMPPGVSDDELALLDDAPRLMRDFHALPPSTKARVGAVIRSMSLGMQHFARETPLVLKSLGEVNRYCFFVAGVVGELLAGLLALVEPKFTCTQDALVDAHHFGQFLQKVNVLKDQPDDEAVGRRLVPSRARLEASAAANARAALRFLLSVPAEQVEFRRFCAWSLFVGLETLAVARRATTTALKVSRGRLAELIGRVEATLRFDEGLRALFEELSAALAVGAVEADSSAPPPIWFRALYEGPLDESALIALGL